MSVPNYKAEVVKLYNEGDYDLTTKEGSGLFTRDVAAYLHDLDADFGELLKSRGRTHVIDPLGRRVAVDAVLYKKTGQSVDVIGSSASPKAKPAWTVDKPRYGEKDWAWPAGSAPKPEPPPAPTPEPKPDLVTERLDSFEAVLRALIRAVEDDRQLLAALDGRLKGIDERLTAEETKKLTLAAKGTTSRVWGHAHEVEIVLEEQ